MFVAQMRASLTTASMVRVVRCVGAASPRGIQKRPAGLVVRFHMIAKIIWFTKEKLCARDLEYVYTMHV